MIHRLHWTRRPGDSPFSSPSSLAPHVNQDVTIEVGRDQTALVVRNHEIRAVLLPNLHRVRVRGTQRRPLDTLTAVAVAREVRPEDVLIFLHLGSFPVALSRPGSELIEGWKGVAHLSLTEPRRFYETFLRHSEDLSTAQFEAICGRLMSGVAAGHPRSIDTPSSRDSLVVRLGVKMRGVGLFLERLDLGATLEAKPNSEALPLVTSAGKL